MGLQQKELIQASYTLSNLFLYIFFSNMVKFIYATLPLLAFSNTEVTNKAVTCSGNQMTVTFDTNRDVSLANLAAGSSCDEANGITINGDDLTTSHSITFDPYACTGQNIDADDVASYSVEVPISFSASLSSVMDLLVKEHSFNASCGFQSSYTATYIFGDIAMDPSDEGEFEGDELSFDLVAYDDDTYANADSWKLNYVLFLFSSQQNGAYILSCNVDLCIASDSASSCANMQSSCSA